MGHLKPRIEITYNGINFNSGIFTVIDDNGDVSEMGRFVKVETSGNFLVLYSNEIIRIHKIFSMNDYLIEIK